MQETVASIHQIRELWDRSVLRLGILLAVLLSGVCQAQTAGLLYDQTDNPEGNGAPDQDFEAGFDAYDSEGADDFLVAWPEGWILTRVETIGTTGTPGGALIDINIYDDNSSSPIGANNLCSYDDVTPVLDDLGSLTTDLPMTCVLGPGRHWLAIQVNQNFATFGQHFWSNRSVQSFAESHWRNPGGGFGLGCSDWEPQTTCGVGGGTAPDFLFKLRGFLVVTSPPVGSEFAVNDPADPGAQDQPALEVRENDGSFVVVWRDLLTGGPTPHTVRGRAFDSAGAPTGPAFEIAIGTADPIYNPAIAEGSDGFLVVWEQAIAGDWEIRGRRLDASGTPVGSILSINQGATGDQRRPAASAGEDGDFLVVWQSQSSPGDDTSGLSILGREVSSLGALVGDEFQVNTYTTEDQACPTLDFDGDVFTIAWQSGGTLTDEDCLPSELEGVVPIDIRSIFGGFVSEGPVADFQISASTEASNLRPQLVVESPGNVAVVWESGLASEGVVPIDILGVAYSFSGLAEGPIVTLGDEVVIDSGGDDSSRPDIASAGGSLAVTWDRDDGSEEIVSKVGASLAGLAASSEFQVNTTVAGEQIYPRVASSPTGFVVVWQSDPSSGGSLDAMDIRGQRLGLSVIPSIFADGFESGDTTAWSSVQP